MKIHHYTTANKLQQIQSSGYLRPSRAMHPGEKPVLWFSKNQDYELSAIKPIIIPPSNELVIDLDFLMKYVGVYRFSMYPTGEFHQWPELAIVAGIKNYKSLELPGLTPSDWIGVMNIVPIVRCVFQYLRPGIGWVNADLQTAVMRCPSNILSRKMK